MSLDDYFLFKVQVKISKMRVFLEEETFNMSLRNDVLFVLSWMA